MAISTRHTANQGSTPQHVSGTIEEVLRLEDKEKIGMSWSDHLADRVASISGSMAFVGFHVVWFSFWIGFNLLIRDSGFDSFPFGLLTMVVSLEAIFLAMFVLMAQNRQALRDDRRAKVDLEVNMIAEREITKALTMLVKINETLGIKSGNDEEVGEMNSPTHVEELIEAAERRREAREPDTDARPRSPIDTES